MFMKVIVKLLLDEVADEIPYRDFIIDHLRVKFGLGLVSEDGLDHPDTDGSHHRLADI